MADGESKRAVCRVLNLNRRTRHALNSFDWQEMAMEIDDHAHQLQSSGCRTNEQGDTQGPHGAKSGTARDRVIDMRCQVGLPAFTNGSPTVGAVQSGTPPPLRAYVV